MNIDWNTKVISVDRTVDTSLFSLVSGSVYEFDTNAFRLALKDIEDSEDGMVHEDTHRHNTQVLLGGVTYARTFEIINGYTVEFLPNSAWTARLAETNNNVADVKVVNQVSVIQQNSAGLAVAAGADAVWDETIESTYTARNLMRIMSAAMAGELSGAESATITIKGVDGSTTRIQAVGVDDAGNRPTVNLDGD